jgi:hypothetical protein
MSVGINNEGEFDLSYSPLPDVCSVVARLQTENLTLGNLNSLKYFKKEHPREFMLNRVYASSASKRILCWLDSNGNEAYPDSRFNCGFHRALLWKRHIEQLIALPVGYSGELCILAVREGHEGVLTHRNKKPYHHLNGTNYFNGHNGEEKEE